MVREKIYAKNAKNEQQLQCPSLETKTAATLRQSGARSNIIILFFLVHSSSVCVWEFGKQKQKQKWNVTILPFNCNGIWIFIHFGPLFVRLLMCVHKPQTAPNKVSNFPLYFVVCVFRIVWLSLSILRFVSKILDGFWSEKIFPQRFAISKYETNKTQPICGSSFPLIRSFSFNFIGHTHTHT